MTDYQRLTVATVNDDFTDRLTNLPGVAALADLILTQESKNSDVRRDLAGHAGWTAYQNRASDAEAGSAVAWKRDKFSLMRTGQSDGLTNTLGRRIGLRKLTWALGRVGNRDVLMIAAHRPPKRFAILWPIFDRSLVARVKLAQSRGRLIVVGIDANTKNPESLARSMGLKVVRPSPGSIDMLLVSPEVKVEQVRRLDKNTSDHHPVIATLLFPQLKQKGFVS